MPVPSNQSTENQIAKKREREIREIEIETEREERSTETKIERESESERQRKGQGVGTWINLGAITKLSLYLSFSCLQNPSSTLS